MKECNTGVQVAASIVAALRQKTGAGMGKCKEALVACQGNLEEAERWLKIQGVKAEVTARATGEGAIAIKLSEDGKQVALIELLRETDFAAKGERFLSLADSIADAVLKTPVGTVTEALGLKVGEEVLHQVLHREISGVIKENIKLNHVAALHFKRYPGAIGTYLHSNRKLGVLVGVKAETDEQAKTPEFQQLVKDIAVHIAGSPETPEYIYEADIPLSKIEDMKQMLLAQLDADGKSAGKPQAVKEKIVAGRMSKYYKEVALMDQPFVKDESKTIRQVIEETSKAIGGKVSVDWFIRRQLGAK
jgi:elongation factor Ts